MIDGGRPYVPFSARVFSWVDPFVFSVPPEWSEGAWFAPSGRLGALHLGTGTSGRLAAKLTALVPSGSPSGRPLSECQFSVLSRSPQCW